MGSKLSQYDYSILTLKCVNLIQEKTVCRLMPMRYGRHYGNEIMQDKRQK